MPANPTPPRPVSETPLAALERLCKLSHDDNCALMAEGCHPDARCDCCLQYDLAEIRTALSRPQGRGDAVDAETLTELDAMSQRELVLFAFLSLGDDEEFEPHVARAALNLWNKRDAASLPSGRGDVSTEAREWLMAWQSPAADAPNCAEWAAEILSALDGQRSARDHNWQTFGPNDVIQGTITVCIKCGLLAPRDGQRREGGTQKQKAAFVLGAEWATMRYLPNGPVGFYAEAVTAAKATYDSTPSSGATK